MSSCLWAQTCCNVKFAMGVASNLPLRFVILSPGPETPNLSSGRVRVRFRAQFHQAAQLHCPNFRCIPSWKPNEESNRLKALLKGISLSEYGSEGILSAVEEVVHPDLLFLAVLDFLAFFFSRKSLFFWAFFSSFPRILEVRPRERILAVFVGFSLFFFSKTARKRRSGQVWFY